MTTVITCNAPGETEALRRPEERRIRIRVFSWGLVKHPMGDFTVDREFYSQMRASFEAIPKAPPILRQHQEDGFLYGKITDIGADDLGIYADAELSDEAYGWWLAGRIADWSPGLIVETTNKHTGEKMQNVLRELSFVSKGHLDNVENKSPAYSLSEYLGDTPEEGEMAEEQETQMEEGVDVEGIAELRGDFEEFKVEVKGMLQAIQEFIAAQKGDDDDDGDSADVPAAEVEDIDMEEDDKYSMADKALAKRLATAEAKIKAAEDRAARAEAATKLEGLEMSDKERGVYLQLACDNPEAFKATVGALKSTLKRMSDATPKGQPSGYTAFLSEAGRQGNVEAGNALRLKALEVVKASKKAGASRLIAMKDAAKGLKINMGDAQQASVVTDVLNEIYG